MTEVIVLLEASKTAPDFNKEIGAAAPKSKPELKVFNEQPLKQAGAPRTKADPSVFALSRKTEGPLVSHELNLEDLVMDVRPEPPPNPLPPAPRPATAKTRPIKDRPEEKLARKLPRATHQRDRSRRAPVLAGLGAVLVLALGVAGYTRIWNGSPDSTAPMPRSDAPSTDVLHAETENRQPEPPPRSTAGHPASNDNAVKDLVRESGTSPSAIHGVPVATKEPPRDPSVLFVDDYSNPPTYSGWVATTPEELAKDPNFRWGQRDGIYFFEASLNNCTWIKTLPGGPYSDFSYEVVGRITGDKRASKGSIILLAVRDGRGFQIRIDGTGALFIEPSCTTDPTQQRGPWFGPIFHKAIKPGAAEFNKVRLQITRRQVEIFVNSERVGPTLTFDWDINPAWVGMGFDCRNPLVRAEFDRVEIKTLPSSTIDRPSGGVDSQQVVRVTKGGGVVLPDGTWVFEASDLKVVEKSAGDPHAQTNMDDFRDGSWSCNRQLWWSWPKVRDTLAVEIPVEADGQYNVFGRFTQAGDAGRVKLELDGKPVQGGTSIDLYGSVTCTKDLPLGVISIANGKTLFKVTIVGKNRSASRSGFGLDEIRFVPVR